MTAATLRLVGRRARRDWPILSALIATVLVAATLLAAGPIYAEAVSSAGLRARLTSAPVADAGIEISARVDADTVAGMDATVREVLDDLDTGVPATAVGLARSDSLVPPARSYRREVIGFVWQQTGRNLLPYLSAEENVTLPLTLAGASRHHRRERARELLAVVGLDDRREHRPAALSGGEQQRTAVAVALANEPAVLLADEPTGELDTATSQELFAAIQHVNEQLGTTVVVLSHDPLVSEQVQRTVAIRDGRTSSETLRHRAADGEGGDEIIAQEYAVLDKVGRLQLPGDYVDALALDRRVRLELEPDHIGLWPDRPSEAAHVPRTAGDRAADDEEEPW